LRVVGDAQKEKERTDRRQFGKDRRKNSRNGRRTSDPHATWRWHRVAWLFAAYAAYLGARTLPETMKRLFGRKVGS